MFFQQVYDKSLSQASGVIVHCQTGDRSAIAYSLLKRSGFERVKNYSGGIKEWNEKGNEIVK